MVIVLCNQLLSSAQSWRSGVGGGLEAFHSTDMLHTISQLQRDRMAVMSPVVLRWRQGLFLEAECPVNRVTPTITLRLHTHNRQHTHVHTSKCHILFSTFKAHTAALKAKLHCPSLLPCPGVRPVSHLQDGIGPQWPAKWTVPLYYLANGSSVVISETNLKNIYCA